MGTSRKSLSIYWRANMAHKALFLGTFATWGVGLVLQKIIMPLVVAQAINHLIAIQSAAHIDYWHEFLPYFGVFFALLVVSQALLDYGLLLVSKLETKVRPELQKRVFDLLINQSLRFHANNFSGALVNQTNKFTGAYVVLTDTLILSMLYVGIVVIFSISVTAYFLPLMALAMAIWTVLFVWLNITLTRKRMRYSRAAAKADSVLTAHLADAVGNVSAIKAFSAEAAEADLHETYTQDRAYKKYLSWLAAVRNDAALGIMMGILQGVVLALSIYAVTQGAVAIGTLLLVQVYVTQLINQLWGLSNTSRNIEQAISDASEMTEILGEELEVKDPARPQTMHIKKGGIEFRNVTFTHDGSNQALFTNFDLTVKPGEKIGLVGHSGSGKTSLTKLLLRFVDIADGQITIDGQNIATVKQADLRNHIAYVPQEPLLFHRTLSENIAYGNPKATQKEIESAAKMAHAHEFIQTLPSGYETMVGERGVKLSGGQRQRIAIARAILKNAPIIVLDEATSALDSESEKLIQDALKKLMQGRTTIVIAHRLSTIQNMDRIIVLEDGAVAQQGTHAELLKQGGTYADLWKHQSGGFLED